MRSRHLFSIVVIYAFWTSGCVKDNVDAKALVQGSAPIDQAVRFQTGDKLRVTVFGEAALTGDYEIGADGALALPLVGSVSAAGQATPELEAALASRLRAHFLRDPRVTIDLLSTRPFYILGEVEKPGEYPYRPGLDIWRAMALAGGQTYRASSSRVLIQRAGDPEWRDVPLAAAPTIAPGDAIRVPERWF